MNHSDGYKTKQRAAILKYMSEHKDCHVTVNQINDYFAESGTQVGVTTIYRHLEKLLEQGFVRKYNINGTTSACFQYAKQDKKCREHFHLMCEKCGCLIHLECSHLDEISEHIFSEHGFKVNPFRTVFYGECQSCLKSKNNDAGENI